MRALVPLLGFCVRVKTTVQLARLRRQRPGIPCAGTDHPVRLYVPTHCRRHAKRATVTPDDVKLLARRKADVVR